MNYTFAQYQESADYIRSQIGGFAPKLAMILGSGLGYMGDIVENPLPGPITKSPHSKGPPPPPPQGGVRLAAREGEEGAVVRGHRPQHGGLLL